jgi:hypothetical protein
LWEKTLTKAFLLWMVKTQNFAKKKKVCSFLYISHKRQLNLGGVKIVLAREIFSVKKWFDFASLPSFFLFPV